MRNLVLGAVSLWLTISTAVVSANSEFPGRQEFPKIPVYEIAELNDRFNDVMIVDTRSHYEYDTLRIKGSVNIPVAEKSFEDEVAKLRARTDKPIVFYCNGRTCFKSYIAVKKAEEVGVQHTYAFDAGVFEWVTQHPDKAALLGKSPVNLNNLIASNKFNARLLDPDTFSEKAMGGTAIVLDIRDKYQRAGIGFFPGKERWASLDDKEKLQKYLKKAKDSNKTLFIYDEVGKQVRWLQYALEELGIKDYYFMDKGAHAYYANLSKWK